MNDVALESWIESIPTVKFRARRVKLGILLIFAFPLFGLYSQGIWSYVAYGLDLALLLFLIHRRLSASRLEGTEPLDRSDPAFREIVEDVEDVQRKIGLSDQAIVLRVDKAGFSTSPSVQSVPRSHKSRVQIAAYMVLPIGFIALHAKERDACRAVLAHELAHVRQNDWQAWAFLSAGTSVWKWFTLPIACLGVILGIAMMMDLHVADRMMAAQSEDARDYAEMNLMAAEKSREEAEQSPFGMNLLRKQERTLDQQLWEIRAGALQSFIAPLLQFLLLRIVLRSRSKSERAADQAAAAVTTPEDILRALEVFGTQRPWWALLEAHPPLNKRIDDLRTAFKLPGTEQSRAGARPARRVFRVRRGLRSLLELDTPTASNSRSRIFVVALVVSAVIARMISMPTMHWVTLMANTEIMSSGEAFWNSFHVMGFPWFWLMIATSLVGSLVLAVLLIVLIKRTGKEVIAIVVATAIGCGVEVVLSSLLPEHSFEGALGYWASIFAANVCFFGFLSTGLRWGLSFGRALVVGTLVSAMGELLATSLDSQWWTLESAEFTSLTEEDLLQAIVRSGLLALIFTALVRWSRARGMKAAIAATA
jgi:hypothetical protein